MAAPQADALVIFGITGDLAYRHVIPALAAMIRRGTLAVPMAQSGRHGRSRVLTDR